MTETQTMERYKVRHALISWQEDRDGQRIALNAFRGQIVTLPPREAARLLGHQAIVSDDAELERPGVLMELPASPDDEELVNWVMAASPSEVARLIQTRPELRDRIESTSTRIVNERAIQDVHLEAVRAALQGVSVPSDMDPSFTLQVPSALLDEDVHFGSPPAPATGTDYGEGTPSNLIDGIVAGSVADVQAYLAEHPEDAQAVLEAETERTGGQPRAGIVSIVKVAASYDSAPS